MRIKFALLFLALLLVPGCAHKTQTPQYNAAVAVDDFAIALKGAQNAEIGINATGVIPADTHKAIETIFLNAAQLGEQAKAAVAAGDFTSAKSYFASAVAALQGLTPQMLFIKNAQSQATFETAVNVAIAIAQQWVNNLTPNTPTITNVVPATAKPTSLEFGIEPKDDSFLRERLVA